MDKMWRIIANVRCESLLKYMKVAQKRQAIKVLKYIQYRMVCMLMIYGK